MRTSDELPFPPVLRALRSIALIATALCFFTPGARGQELDVGLYDCSILRTIQLSFADAGFWDELTEVSSTEDEYAVADMVVDGETYPGVGVRFRGNTSQIGVGFKRSFKIAVDHTDPEQRLYGYRTLKLNNGASDPSFLREVLYSRIGHEYCPSPTANHVKLVLNGESWGVYVNVQQFNKDFLDEWFDGNDGNRWKSPSGSGTGDGTDPGAGGLPGGGGWPPPRGGGPPPRRGGRPPRGGGGVGGGGLLARGPEVEARRPEVGACRPEVDSRAVTAH